MREVANRRVRQPSLLDPELDAGISSGAALVTAEDHNQAFDFIDSALAVLRVFQQSIAIAQTPHFGLAGEAWSARVNFLQMSETAASGGRTHQGHHRGVTFNDRQRGELAASAGYQFAASAIGNPNPNEGQSRALLGINLTSRAVLETRPAMQLFLAVLAAEAMLLEDDQTAQTLRLAQRDAFLLCGRHVAGGPTLCGRDRPTCPLLGISPETDRGRKKLERFAPVCSEFGRVLLWYRDRSGVAHRGRADFPEKEESRVTYWLTTRLLPQALQWFAEYPDEPIQCLEREIAELPKPPKDQDGRYLAEEDLKSLGFG